MAPASLLSVRAELQCPSIQRKLAVAHSVTHVTMGEGILCPLPRGRGQNWSTPAVAEGVTPSLQVRAKGPGRWPQYSLNIDSPFTLGSEHESSGA